MKAFKSSKDLPTSQVKNNKKNPVLKPQFRVLIITLQRLGAFHRRKKPKFV